MPYDFDDPTTIGDVDLNSDGNFDDSLPSDYSFDGGSTLSWSDSGQLGDISLGDYDGNDDSYIGGGNNTSAVPPATNSGGSFWSTIAPVLGGLIATGGAVAIANSPGSQQSIANIGNTLNNAGISGTGLTGIGGDLLNPLLNVFKNTTEQQDTQNMVSSFTPWLLIGGGIIILIMLFKK